jgi:hypothetical protein
MKYYKMQFFQQYKKLIYSVNMIVKNEFKYKLGRKFKISLIEQITLTIFKLKYNLPDIALEDLFDIDHVKISRIIHRITYYLSQFNTSNLSTINNNFYIVDSTTLRIGKCKNNATYSGYKHHHGVKFQLVINDLNQMMCVSKGYESSHHDKKIFLMEYDNLMKKLDKNNDIIGR